MHKIRYYNNQQQLNGGDSASRGKSDWDFRCLCNFFLWKMHNNKMFDLENEGQGHGVQHSQRCYSMENTKRGKSHMKHFCDSSQRFRDINASYL